MPKRKPKSAHWSRRIATLAGLALILFAACEGYLALRSDRGQIAAARWLPWSDEARLTLLVGRQLRRGLEAAGVSRDSIRELSFASTGEAETPAAGSPPRNR